MVVWAHNEHIAMSKAYTWNKPTMGYILRQWYGPAYYALGFAFNEGGFQTIGMSKDYVSTDTLTEFTLPPAPEGSIPWYLEQARASRQYRDYLVDFRSAPRSGPFAEWLKTPRRFISIGSGFSYDFPLDDYMWEIVPGTKYDGLVFIAKTTRARPTPTGERRARTN